jgi:hypothetical protein
LPEIASMTIAHYDYRVSEDYLKYEFCSEGPRGEIRKVILFKRISLQGRLVFNLAFGDLDDLGGFSDLVVSNNHDAEKVLATVAHAVILFTNIHPHVLVYAEGSTPSRTRRYQMGINKFWKEIELDFRIFGLSKEGGFEPFKAGKNYMGFAVTRKKINFIE